MLNWILFWISLKTTTTPEREFNASYLDAVEYVNHWIFEVFCEDPSIPEQPTFCFSYIQQFSESGTSFLFFLRNTHQFFESGNVFSLNSSKTIWIMI